MPWSKDHKTKQKLISVSLDLFYKNGCENTPIEAIVNKAGLSKGAFFHYFKTKEDLLEAIAQKYAQEVADVMTRVADRDGLNAVDKFKRIMTEGKRHKIAHSQEYKKVGLILYDYKNAKVQSKILESMIECTTPPIEKIIKQGVKEGVFKVDFPDETAEAFMRFMFMMRDPIMKIMTKKMTAEEFSQAILKKIAFFESMINRILGAEPGTLKLPRINKQLIKLMKLFVK